MLGNCSRACKGFEVADRESDLTGSLWPRSGAFVSSPRREHFAHETLRCAGAEMWLTGACTPDQVFRLDHRRVALVEALKETSETEVNSVPDPAVCSGNVVVMQRQGHVSLWNTAVPILHRASKLQGHDLAARLPAFSEIAVCPCSACN